MLALFFTELYSEGGLEGFMLIRRKEKDEVKNKGSQTDIKSENDELFNYKLGEKKNRKIEGEFFANGKKKKSPKKTFNIL